MSNFKLNTDTTKLDLTNAHSLAVASQLVYKDWGLVEATVKNDWRFPKFKYFEEEFDTQAFMAANDDVLLFIFRGTEPTKIEDWKTDLKAKLIDNPAGQVHAGFNNSLNTIWDDMKSTFDQWYTNQSVWLAGHSLGGALATLAAERLDRDQIKINGIYTYGQPMAADKNFVKKFDHTFGSKTFRFVNDEDIVTKVPGFSPYKHTRTECYLDSKGKLHLNNIFWIRLKDHVNAVTGRSSAFAIEHKLTQPGAIGDHSLTYYIEAIEKNLSDATKKSGGFVNHINS